MAGVLQGRTAAAGRTGPGVAAAWLAKLLDLTDVEAHGRGRVRLHMIALMRWAAIGGQLFTIFFVHFSLGIDLPLGWLLPAVLLTVVLNAALHAGRRATVRLSEPHAVVIFGYDLLVLTYLLAITGGMSNPFTFLLLLPVVLGAMSLGKWATLGLTGLAFLCIVALNLWGWPLPWFEGHLILPPLYKAVTALAMGLAVGLVALYTWCLANDARQQTDALAATQQALAREQQLSALGGQAAAVAHMLGTPLATINVVAKELTLGLAKDSPLAEDAAELLTQARRCREILATLSRHEGDPRDHERYTAAPLSGQIRDLAAQHPRAEVEIVVRTLPEGVEEPMVALGPEIRHSLTNLIDNAIEFAQTNVTITLELKDEALTLTIQDDGPGFPPEVLDWLGEPFLSTRRKSGGLGLGVFIANTLLARTGAKLHFANNARGARVRTCWPDGLPTVPAVV